MAERTRRNDSDQSPSAPTRRTVLRGAMLAGAAVPFLAACGSDSTPPGGNGGNNNAAGPASNGRVNGGGGGGGGGGGEKLAPTTQVPEGGGLILDSEEVVITQPAAGEFKCFTAICTHMRCTVSNVSGGTINCTCHGSMFSIEDGSVVGGPAPAPLAQKKITVTGKNISLA